MSTITPVVTISSAVLTPSNITASLTANQSLSASLNFGEATVLANTIFTYLGTVLTLDDLPENPENGDTYMVESENSNYAWMGSGWNDIGSNTMSEQLTQAEKDALIGLLN